MCSGRYTYIHISIAIYYLPKIREEEDILLERFHRIQSDS